jgi:hypothetical protein
MAEEERKDFQDLCACIGFVVVTWAFAEQSLDRIVSVIYDQCGGSTITKNTPWSLKPKIDFLRQAFKQFVALQPYAEQGNEILDSLSALSQQRHNLVHGVVTRINLEDGIFPIEKFDYRNKTLEKIQFDPIAFPQLAQDLVDLGKTITLFDHALRLRFRS